MKSLKKGILALGLTLGIIASVGSGSVFASAFASGIVKGYSTTGHSYCYYTYGNSSTSYNRSGYVAVSSVYNYINKSTLSTGTKTRSSTKNNGYFIDVDVYAPYNCRSVNMYSTHVVSYGGQTWTGSTDDKY